MPYVLDLPRALAARGLDVEVVPGWQTRGSAAFNPYGAVCHWTAGPPTGDRPSLKVVVEGRPGLVGPLANVFLPRGLTPERRKVVVVAAGRANHAGAGTWRGLLGNSAVFGTEAENSGGGEWTDFQRWAYPRINAAYVDLGARPENVCGHNEWAPARKIDIRDWPMPAMRAQVTALLTTTAGSRIPDLEDDMTPEQYATLQQVQSLLEAVAQSVGRAESNAFAAVKALPVVTRTEGTVSEVQSLLEAVASSVGRAESNAFQAVKALTGVRGDLAAALQQEGADATPDQVEAALRRVLGSLDNQEVS